MTELIRYEKGRLFCEDLAVAALAETVQTPFYCYSATMIRRRYRAFAGAVSPLGGRVCYAVKACSNQAVLTLLAQEGAGADVVSGGEVRRALAAGFDPDRIVFSGVAKSREELDFAIAAGVGQINVENAPELDLISTLAVTHGRVVRVAIRVNPDVDALTHPKITTGKSDNKFGIPLHQVVDLYATAARLPGLSPTAIALHIGSQILDLSPYRTAYLKLSDLVLTLRAAGHRIDHLDLGGGLGVPYHGEGDADLTQYVEIVRETVGSLQAGLTFEPGRFIVAEAGMLITRVLVVKPGGERRMIVVDGAMNDLIRPTLYDAYHPVIPVLEPPKDAPLTLSDVVGPVCESGDYLAIERDLPLVQYNDLMAVQFAGAYGAVMSSTYNTRLLVPELLVDGGRAAIIRPRPCYDTLIGLDRVPDWLAIDRSGAAQS